jgi:hypothetical protein
MAGLSVSAVSWGSAVHASDASPLQFGPAADWVRPVTPAAPAYEMSKADHAITNRSIQVRYSDNGEQIYTETLVRIQTSRGLAAARPTVEWDPGGDIVTVNKAQLIRNGQVIDLLGRGQSFIIIRRETDLDHAMINGALTAVLQPDGVEVGDIVDFAYTLTRRNAVLGTLSEDLWQGMGSGVVGKRDYRFMWPADKPLHWRLSDDLPIPNIVTANGESELTLNVDAYTRPVAPDQAPDRYGRFGEVQFSQFTSWPQVSALMAPYYDKAAVLDAQSPLKAEVAKIRALSDDPKVQAAAALNLVQQKVRYLYVRANDGFLPPSADLTWIRRWGDCKAKTALLVALLRDLGITADPALVDIDAGDGMDTRLPALALFDHIIVRATIGGKAYWLDGTHDVDGRLDDLGVPGEKWALPVTAAGEDLQPLIVPPLDMPMAERHVDLDATAGIDAPAKAHVEVVMHGRAALEADMAWQELLPEQMDARMRLYWKQQYPWITIDTLAQSFDAATSQMHYVMDGVAHMRWTKSKEGQPRFLETDGYDVAEAPKPPVRKKGLHDDAPVKVDAYPMYVRSTETIRLPDNGNGFTILGHPVDETVAGVAMKRTFALKDGVFSMETTDRALTPEIPLAEAMASTGELKILSSSAVILQSLGRSAVGEATGTGAAAATGTPASTTGDGQATISGSDAVWTDPDAVVAGTHKASLPDTGTPSVDTLDALTQLYAGYTRN